MTKFTFDVYNNRRSCTLTYSIVKTSEGWYISHNAINGNCSPDGMPLFYENFDQDNISYPENFGSFLEWIWGQIDGRKLSNHEAQIKLQELADWVTICEKNEPKWDGWNK